MATGAGRLALAALAGVAFALLLRSTDGGAEPPVTAPTDEAAADTHASGVRSTASADAGRRTPASTPRTPTLHPGLPSDTPQPRRIRGRVQRDGVGVDDLTVEATNAAHAASTQTTRDGRFELIAFAPVDDARIALTAPDGERVVVDNQVPWDSRGVELAWPFESGVEVRVVHADSGDAIAGARVYARPVGSGTDAAPRTLDQRTNAGGLALFPHLGSGAVDVHVEATGLMSLDIPFVHIGCSRRERVRIAMAAPIERVLTVRGATDIPLPFAQASLWRQANSEDPVGSLVGGRDTPWEATFMTRAPIDEAYTDARGQCRLRAPAQLNCTLLVAGSPHEPSCRDGVRLAAMPEPWVETLASGAVIVGRIDGATRNLCRRVRVERLDANAHGLTAQGSAIDADGNFAAAGLPSGSWRVFVVSQGDADKHAIADVRDLRPGEIRRVDHSLGVAAVWGTVRHNDHSPMELTAEALDGGYHHSIPVADGQFSARLLAGRYRFRVFSFEASCPLFPGEYHLEAGTGQQLDLRLRTHEVRVHVRRQGYPAPRLRLAAGPSLSAELLPAERDRNTLHACSEGTDEHGCARFQLPAGAHTLFHLPANSATKDGHGARRLGTVHVEPLSALQHITLQLPVDW